jgi:hypothetical protein
MAKKLADFQEQIDRLQKQIDNIVVMQSKPLNQLFKDIEYFDNLNIKNLILQHISQATEPVILKNQVVLWTDTDDNKTYIVANFNGTTNHIECV